MDEDEEEDVKIQPITKSFSKPTQSPVVTQTPVTKTQSQLQSQSQSKPSQSQSFLGKPSQSQSQPVVKKSQSQEEDEDESSQKKPVVCSYVIRDVKKGIVLEILL
jgi:hypothetical protein